MRGELAARAESRGAGPLSPLQWGGVVPAWGAGLTHVQRGEALAGGAVWGWSFSALPVAPACTPFASPFCSHAHPCCSCLLGLRARGGCSGPRSDRAWGDLTLFPLAPPPGLATSETQAPGVLS